MNWWLWGVVLLIQAAAFTFVSRARNSGSWQYNAVASVFSNGVWFAGQFIVVDTFLRVKESGDTTLLVLAGVFYTALSTVGSAGMQKVLMTYIEKGRRKVGAN